MSDLVVGPGSATTATNPGAEDISVTITPYANNDSCDQPVCKWWFKGHEISTSSTFDYEEEEPPGSGTMVPYTAVAQVNLAQSWTRATKGEDNEKCIPPYTDLIRVQDIPVNAQQWDTTVHSRYLKIPYYPTTDIRYTRRVDQRADGQGVIESIVQVTVENECEMIYPIPGLAEAQSTSGSASIQYRITNDEYKVEAGFPYNEIPDDAEIISIVEDDTFIDNGEVKRCECELFIFGKAFWPDPPPGHLNHPEGSIELIYKFPCCAFNEYEPAKAFGGLWAEGYNTEQRQEEQAENIVVAVRNVGPDNVDDVFLNLKTGEPVDIKNIDKEIIILEGNSIPGDDQDDIGEIVDTNIPLAGIPAAADPDDAVKYLMYAAPAACFKIKDGFEILNKTRAKGGFECRVGNSKTGKNLDSPVIQVNCGPVKKVVPLLDRTCFKIKNGYEKDCANGIEVGPCKQSTPQIEADGTCFKIQNGYEKTCATGEC
jgi:hypothetical protein